MPEYLVPGVFVEELAHLPPVVAEVESAVPAFVGYTAFARRERAGDLRGVPQRIRSLLEFEALYGTAWPDIVQRVEVDQKGAFLSVGINNAYHLYDALRLFFANGGGDCYIVSVGGFSTRGRVTAAALVAGMQALAPIDDVSLLLCPDAVALSAAGRAKLQQAALAQCAELQDRFAVFDLGEGDRLGVEFRQKLGMANLRHGAAYTPWLLIHPALRVGYAQLRDKLFRQGVRVKLSDLVSDAAALELITRLESLLEKPRLLWVVEEMAQCERELSACCPVYREIVQGISRMSYPCPPSGAVVGIYARVDRERGVWKAPANVVVNAIAGLATTYTSAELDALNVDTISGKSINPIRQIVGKGWMVWGGRTLAGNDNEWRYVSVRRFCIMVEESIRKSTERFVFEPNDATTWIKVRSMIEDYLLQKWREGALQGAKPEHAFYVRCGEGQTMTALDIVEGRMIIEIGLAVVRQAEFIVLRFTCLMQEG